MIIYTVSKLVSSQPHFVYDLIRFNYQIFNRRLDILNKSIKIRMSHTFDLIEYLAQVNTT